MIAPTSNAISQGKHGTYNAVDYRAKDPNENWRKEIYAPEDIRISAYGDNGTAGKQIQAYSLDGTRRHGFAHTESSNVKVGEVYKKGQLIGIMGYTGYTIPAGVLGTHLHWTIRLSNGTYVYPPTLVNETNLKGAEMFNTREEVIEAYLMLRGVRPSDPEINSWLGQSKQRFFQVAKAEADQYRQALADVRQALLNEQAKPAKEIIKEVITIVEKPVEVIKIQEIPVEVIKEVEKPVTWSKVADFFRDLINKFLRKS